MQSQSGDVFERCSERVNKGDTKLEEENKEKVGKVAQAIAVKLFARATSKLFQISE